MCWVNPQKYLKVTSDPSVTELRSRKEMAKLLSWAWFWLKSIQAKDSPHLCSCTIAEVTAWQQTWSNPALWHWQPNKYLLLPKRAIFHGLSGAITVGTRSYNPESHHGEASRLNLPGKEPSCRISNALTVTLDLNVCKHAAELLPAEQEPRRWLHSSRDGNCWLLQLHTS